MITERFNFDEDIDLENIARGYGNIEVRVTGYWSDVITIRVQRDWYGEEKWKVTVSHSSGGRDAKVIEDDVAAERNFGLAMIAACEFADSLKLRIHEFEAAYQKRRAEQAEVARLAQEAHERAVEADAPLGLRSAGELVGRLLENGKGTIAMYQRGKADPVRQITTRGWGNSIIYLNGQRIAKKQALKQLAESSARSQYVV